MLFVLERRESPSWLSTLFPFPAVVEPAGVVRVQVGIDAAITAKHQIAVRETAADGSVVTQRFVAAPTLAGLTSLSQRLAKYPGVVAVAEPTSMAWLPLALSLEAGGGRLALIGARLSARLRGAVPVHAAEPGGAEPPGVRDRVG